MGLALASDRRKSPPPLGASPLSPETTSNLYQSYNFQSFSTFPCLLFQQQQSCTSSNIVVEQHKNRYVFSNPGTLLISRSQYYKGGESVCRNNSLQKMFMMIGRAEKAGSGVDKIISGWKDANLAHPFIDESSRPDKVVLELRLVLDLHRADITRLLQELCRSRYLVSYGSGRGTHYRINLKFAEEREAANGASNGVSNGVSSEGGRPRARLNGNELKSRIQDVCRDWMTIEEIASRVSRSIPYIKKIIPEMVKTGLLERRFPDSPHHPYQSYKTK